jgi:hypothetical protein
VCEGCEVTLLVAVCCRYAVWGGVGGSHGWVGVVGLHCFWKQHWVSFACLVGVCLGVAVSGAGIPAVLVG